MYGVDGLEISDVIGALPINGSPNLPPMWPPPCPAARACNHSKSASSSQNNKIAFHLNISTADPAVPQISGSAARAVEIAM